MDDKRWREEVDRRKELKRVVEDVLEKLHQSVTQSVPQETTPQETM